MQKKKIAEDMTWILQEALESFPQLNQNELDKLAGFLGRAYGAGLIGSLFENKQKKASDN